MRRTFALFLSAPLACFSTDLIKFESGKAALARDVNENFLRLDTAISSRATTSDLTVSAALSKADNATLADTLRAVSERTRLADLANADSIRIISERLRRDSVALSQFQAKVREDSAATSADIQSLQTTVSGLGSGGLPAWAISGQTNAIAKFTGANTVGNSSLVDDGASVTTASTLSVSGGTIRLDNTNANRLEFASNGIGLPSFGAHSVGAKAVWYSDLSSTYGEYATGVNFYTLWNSVPQANATHGFSWIAGETPVMTLNGEGNLDVTGDLRSHGSLHVDGELAVDNKVVISGGTLTFDAPSNYLDFGQNGTAPPQVDARSAGTKAVWFSQQNRRPGEVDYATGIDNVTLWNSIPLNTSTYAFKWFGGIEEVMKLDGAGNLTVTGAINGKVVTRGIPASNVADYVFKPGYKLASLSEVEAFTQANGHLPEVPSAQDVEKNGLDLAQMNLVLLKKVEELTLHAISQQKLLEAQRSELVAQKDRLDRLEAR
ncbi:MAG: hypothetical protein IPO40_13185 [Fibrobacteres bacterium]|nr:hypothetical protein [Fibrobacterota bacterium]